MPFLAPTGCRQNSDWPTSFYHCLLLRLLSRLVTPLVVPPYRSSGIGIRVSGPPGRRARQSSSISPQRRIVCLHIASTSKRMIHARPTTIDAFYLILLYVPMIINNLRAFNPGILDSNSSSRVNYWNVKLINRLWSSINVFLKC